MKFCCQAFKERAELPREKGFNIRIIKLEQEDLISGKYLYRTFIAPDYKVTDKCLPMMLISYCPYCGKKLSKIIINDDYLNEEVENFRNIFLGRK